MAVNQVEMGMKLIAAHEEHSDFKGPKPEGVILKVEEFLDIEFPNSFRYFLLKLGDGALGGTEFYGIKNDEFDKDSLSYGIRRTVEFRKDYSLPTTMVVVAETGDGGFYVLETAEMNQEKECPVYEWWANIDDRVKVADSFGEFFLNLIQNEVEYIEEDDEEE